MIYGGIMNDVQITETALLILSTMQTPIHGYEIMKRINETLNPWMSIGPATMYTTLAKLEKHKLCSILVEQNRKVYHLTSYGKQTLEEEIQRRERMLLFMRAQ